MSKNIDYKAAVAFKARERFRSKNTKIEIEGNEAKMYLFGNLIAKSDGNDILINSCGWNTVTTRNRLNSLGANIRLSKGSFIIDEKYEWDGDWIDITKTSNRL